MRNAARQPAIAWQFPIYEYTPEASPQLWQAAGGSSGQSAKLGAKSADR